jgi:hypothetical protein
MRNFTKKALIGAVLVLLGGPVFAVSFAIDGNVGTNFSAVTPGIGFKVGFDRVDILTGVDYCGGTDKYEFGSPYSTSGYSLSFNSFGIFAGVAPKAKLTGKWSLSIPIVAKYYFGNSTGAEYDNSSTPITAGDIKTSKNSGFAVQAGARAEYSFSDHWGFYTGFIFQVYQMRTYDNEYYLSTSQSGGTYTRTQTYQSWLETGQVQMGVAYKF